jgi:serine protease AprX
MRNEQRAAIRWRAGAALAAVASLAAAAPAAAAPVKPVEVVVVTEPGTTPRAAIENAGGKLDRELPLIHAASARVPADAVAALRDARGVTSVTRDRAFALRSDPPASQFSGITPSALRTLIGADRLDPTAEGGAGVDVALVDSGVAPVPGLAGRIVDGPDFSTEGGDPAFAHVDAFGHGTHMAGIVAGRDDAGAENGVAPGARIVNIKVADHEGATSLARLLAGIDWSVREGRRNGLNVRVLNLAFGADTEGGYRTDPLAMAVEQAWKRGVVVVTSAGNGGSGAGGLDSPAYDPYVVAVGAQDTGGTPDRSDDTVAEFSSRGTGERAPDLVAPGVGIVSLRVPGGFLDEEFPGARVGERYFRGSGTSQAAAVVSGAAALVLQRRPGLSPDELKAALRAEADPLTGSDPLAAGAGALDVPGSAAAAVSGARQSWPPARAGAWRGRGALGLDLAVERPDGSGWTASKWTASKWTASKWTASKWTASKWTASKWTASKWTASRWTASRWTAASWDASTP